MERKTPAACEQEKAEKLVSVCREILLNARNELYLNLRFMDAALSSLNFVPDFTAEGAGTDGYHYTYQPDFLAGRFMSGRVLVNRLYFHSVLHCVFVHMDTRGKREEGLWNLACDIAVEYLIDSMDMKCLHRPQTPARRECYLRLKEKNGVMNAQSIYRCLQEEKLPEGRYLALMAEFYADNHSYWTDENDRPRMASDRKNKWDGMRETMETEMETFSKKASDEAGELSRQVRIENREQYDYREFLRKFSVMRETVQIDTDAFDYIYYDYGLRTYGNMPLIEPLETKEVKKIEEFAVVIDTSMSCSGELVQRFLEETYDVLSQSESFFRRVNVHVIQCDDQIRSDVVITRAEDLTDYMEHLTLKGLGGTDFRPAFEYVNGLRAAGAFARLRGLIYFTDGKGIYPVQAPPYDTAFVFVKDQYSDESVPPWAMKVILEADDLMEKGQNEPETGNMGLLQKEEQERTT